MGRLVTVVCRESGLSPHRRFFALIEPVEGGRGSAATGGLPGTVALARSILTPCVPCIPTVCLDATSLVVCSYGCDDGRIGPTRCALLGAVRGDRYGGCCVCRTPPAAAR